MSEEALNHISTEFNGKFEQTPYANFFEKLGFAVYSRSWKPNLEVLEKAVHDEYHEKMAGLSQRYDEIAKDKIDQAERDRLMDICAKPLSNRERKIIRLDAMRSRTAEETELKTERDYRLGMIRVHREIWRSDELKDAILDERRDERDRKFEQLLDKHKEMLKNTHVPLESIQAIVEESYAHRAEFGSRVGSIVHHMVDKIANQLAQFVGLKTIVDSEKTVINRGGIGT